MKIAQIPTRLVGELLLIVGLAQVVVTLALPLMAETAALWAKAYFGAVLLVVLSAPAAYWRCMAAVRRVGVGDTASADRAPGMSPARQRRGAIAMTALTQILGLVLTAAAVIWLDRSIEADAQGQFTRHVERMEAEIMRRFTLPVYGLKGARGVYAVNRQLSRAQFRAYVESRDLPTEFPGVRGFGLMERVLRPDLNRFVAAARADQAPDFEVTTTGAADDLYVVKMIEPLSENHQALGRDLGSESVRREAIERAVATGQPALSGKLNLLQDRDRTPGFLFILPVFRHGTDPVELEQRRAALVGLLYAPIIVRDLLTGVVDIADRAVNIRLLLPEADSPGQVVFDAELPALAAAGEGARRFEASRWLTIGGRQLVLHASASPGFVAGIQRSSLAYVAMGGALLSMLLALSVWLLAVGRMRALTLAQRMTLDLERLARVVRSTSNAVSITDRDLRITWVNEGFTRVTGFSAADAYGRTPGELLGSGKADPVVLQRLAEAAAAGQQCRVEILNRTKDGREFWVDTEIQPMHDAQGALTGFMEIASDITARKTALAELAREQQQLQNILQGTRVGTWDLDELSGVTEVNERWAGMLGYTRAELGPITTAVWTRLAHRDDLRRSAELLRKHFEGELDYYECEIRLRHRLGHWVWVLSRGQVFQRDASGKVERMAGTHMDVTERKSAEQAQQSTTVMLQAILDNLPCGLSVFDADLQLLAHTRQFRSLLDLPDSLFGPEGTSFESIIRHNAERGEYGEYGPGDVDAIVALIVERARHPVPHQIERLRPDGVALEIRGAPLPTGGFVTTYTDISERKRAEITIRDSEHLMRLVIDNIPARIAYWDMDHRLKFANKPFLERFGGHLADCVGQSDVEILGEARVAASLAQIEAARRGEMQSFEREDRSADGEASHILTHLIPDWWNEQVQGVVTLTMDITFVKKAEADLRLANQALAIERDRAEQASLAKGQFVANMSHEIRTPMNAILGMLKLLSRTPLTERQQDYTRKTERAARSLLGLINDILDFSKAEAGKMTLDPRPFAVDGLLRDLAVVLQANMGSKPVELRFDRDAALPPCLVGDDMRLQQVLLNLAGNALKFTDSGEVLLQLRLLERRDELCRVAFVVRDTGIGIAPEQQQAVFSSFSQAEASTTRRFGGTGLGLSISQRLVELMGGRIALDSELGRGSTFHFELTLPVGEGSGEPAVEPGIAQGQPRLQGLRLLLVEDNLNNQQVAQELLEAEGASVTLADDGRQGVAAVAAADPLFDAVLMDVQMPVMDGFTATREIRRQRGLADLLIIAMTANASADDRQACLAAGMNDHIGKPFDIDALVALLRQRLGRDQGDLGIAAPARSDSSGALPGLSEADLAEARSQGLEIAAALARLGGRGDVWARSARSFVKRLPDLPAEVGRLLGEASRIDALRCLHTLKGEAGTLGAARLAGQAAAFEADLRKGGANVEADAQLVAQGLAALTEHGEQTGAALQSILRQYDLARPSVPNPAASADRPGLMQALGALLKLLEDDDMAATDQFSALQQAHEPHWAEALEPLGEAIAGLDFAQAASECRALMGRLAAHD
ncbi:CHASE domain-containing protein [Roseateles toxinivorans]|uniref:Virulence sensor protein BvgS n=1 Tax=Roseateles toxinivorans TaxID=270368 RepID=A0A4R6QFJ0_9BURK|nr:CHASE domain-containing protein [Roseateles toxinivorans]TDP61673.1 PAS domain S-box-containing protein [Roseateles toxinivorans]